MLNEIGIKKIGGSLAIIIPPLIANWLEIGVGDIMCLQDEEGKHGKYISMWKQQNE